ncbi:delta-9 fatty acid desaturase [Hypoxylon argillaceum]|nr:delta-9 fatty acid desaturase [Hypoxylon argillaceum]
MGSHKEGGVHISHQPFTWHNWHQHVHWFNTSCLILIPLAGCVAAYFTPLQPLTAIWALIYYSWTGLGITAGYHRLWSHRSYSASLPLQLFLAAGGTGAFQGSIRWWSRGHRAHHRYTDTVKDPYNIRKGFLHSHMGWMVLHQDPKRNGRTEISDLNADRLVIWQHRNYFPLVLTFALGVPTLVAGLGWNDWVGGFLYAAILRIFFFQQATFCINSLAHWIGDQPFDDKHSPRDNFVAALITFGEGYHNFHHEFPSDFRNGIFWYQYDPTKWSIMIWKRLGLAYDLKTFPSNEIQKGQVQQLQKKLDLQRAALDWGIPLTQLPIMEWDDFVSQSQLQERPWIVIAGVVHDLTEFIHDHPGGKRLITSAIGKDATSMFNGGVYDHSNAAHNILSTYRIGIIRGGGEVEIWRRKYYISNTESSTKSAGVAFLRCGSPGT